jgi:hypothetical protein
MVRRSFSKEGLAVFKNNLPCRANQRLISIVATIKARAEKSAAGFFIWNFRIGRRPHVTTLHLPIVAPASSARRRPNHY